MRTIRGTVVSVERLPRGIMLRLGARTWLYLSSETGRECEDLYPGSKVRAVVSGQVEKHGRKAHVVERIESSALDLKSTEDTILECLRKCSKPGLARKLSRHPAMMRRYAKDPGKLFEDDLVDLYTMLTIYRSTGIHPDESRLVDFFLKHYAEQLYRDATNSFSPQADQIVRVNTLVRLAFEKLRAYDFEISEDTVRERLKENPWVVVENGVVYPAVVHRCRKEVFDFIESCGITHREYGSLEEAVEKERVVAVVGAAGTGKTTLCLRVLESMNLSYVEKVAPTGRAARRIGGSTIHRWLGYNGKDFTEKDRYADVLFVDEASMMSWRLFAEVFRPGRFNRLILAGDPDQLPPVGDTCAFQEIISRIPVVRLEKVHRGEMDVQVLRANSHRDALRTTCALVRHFERTEQDYAIISPFNDGLLGVKVINSIVDRLTGKRRVLITKNVYDSTGRLVAANGDLGILLSQGDGVCRVRLETGEVVEVCSEHVERGHCFTVHKTQSHEWDYVVFLQPVRELGEKILNTAVTRGKKKTFVIQVRA